MNEIHPDSSQASVKELVANATNATVSDEDLKIILSYYNNLGKQEDGLYNYKKIPFKAFGEILSKSNSVAFQSLVHTGDLVELAMFGPGSDKLKPFVKNTDLHYFMLEAAEIENKF